MPNNRQSNFELLRILCMLGVLVGHVLLYLYADQLHSMDWSLPNQMRMALMNACAVAVNCFVLISGYFTIQFSWKRVLRFCGICLCYAFLGWLCLGGDWKQVVFPISESGLWFPICYLGLMLVSPLLNAGLLALKEHELIRTVGLLLFVDIYLGYWHQSDCIGVDGYGLFHLVCIYCLGYLIAQRNLILPHAGGWFLVCVVLMTVLHAVKQVWLPIAVIYSLHFNSPMLIIASVLLFLWAKGLSIQSRVVNWIASSVFAVYLVHCNPSFAPVLQGWEYQIWESSDSPLVVFFLLVLLIIGVFLGSIALDKCIQRILLALSNIIFAARAN